MQFDDLVHREVPDRWRQRPIWLNDANPALRKTSAQDVCDCEQGVVRSEAQIVDSDTLNLQPGWPKRVGLQSE